MKAAVYRRYGGPEVVKVEDVPKPEPGPGEVLVRVRAATVSSADHRIRSLKMPAGFGPFARLAFGLTAPRKPILGSELAGEVAALGSGVTKYKVGDRVFAFPGFALGAHVEYRAMPEDGRICPMPASFSFEQAASMCFGGSTALHYLSLVKLARGERILVIGASGAVGNAAAQIAKAMGAHVTGVTSTPNVALVKELGVDVIDYKKADFRRTGPYDVIFEAVGSSGYEECRAALKETGRLILAVASLYQLLGTLAPKSASHKVFAGPSKERVEDLLVLKRLADEGQYRPLIDSVFPIERIVEAHDRVDTGRKRGNVVVTL